MKKILSFVLAFATFIGVMVTPAFNLRTINAYAETSKEVTTSNSGSKNGWYVSNDKKIYYVNGTKVSGKTKKIDGKIYLFDSNGYLQTDGIHEVNGKKYYSDKDGIVKCNQWVSHKYAKSGNTYYYATSTGKITEYRFKKQSNSDIYLYVNGKKFIGNNASRKPVVSQICAPYVICGGHVLYAKALNANANIGFVPVLIKNG